MALGRLVMGMADRPNVMIIPGITLERARKEIMEMKHESPCIKCSERKFYAQRFDIHISGEDCPYECEEYEKWKTEQIEKAQEEIKRLRGMLK